jgi:hypothetical protein
MNLPLPEDIVAILEETNIGAPSSEQVQYYHVIYFAANKITAYL